MGMENRLIVFVLTTIFWFLLWWWKAIRQVNRKALISSLVLVIVVTVYYFFNTLYHVACPSPYYADTPEYVAGYRAACYASLPSRLLVFFAGLASIWFVRRLFKKERYIVAGRIIIAFLCLSVFVELIDYIIYGHAFEKAFWAAHLDIRSSQGIF